jgi:acyl carrier protein
MQLLASASRLDVCEEQATTDAVRAILLNHLSLRVASDNEDLLTAGLLDSLNLVRLISYIEEKFGLQLPISDVGLDSFRSVASIAELVQRRRALADPGEEMGVPSEPTGLVHEIRVLLEDKLSFCVDDIETDLFQTGYLDSMSLVQLILELETHFCLTIPIQDLDLAALRSVASIAELIDRRQRADAAL